MEVKFAANPGKEFLGSYEHALHSTIGVKGAPTGTVPVDITDAFNQVIEDQILRFLVDFQKWTCSWSAPEANSPPVS